MKEIISETNNKVDMSKVNHPSHYEATTSLECIEAMQLAYGSNAVADFCLCNAFKYMWRYKNKNGQEDLEKAEWYLNYGIKLAYDDIMLKRFEDSMDLLRYLKGKIEKEI